MDKKNLFMLATGIVIGSCATWKYVSVRERNRADEEIADVKRIYSSKKNQEENSSEDIPEKETYTPIEEDKNHNKEIIEKMNYSSFSKKVEKEKKVERPYIITPEDFGECGYSTVSLTYYADDVLTYEDDDELIDNRDEIVGDDAVNHFGEYEDDSVFVRNDAKKCDYEILYDQRNYHDIYPE
jgi:hypothetical protein